MDYKFLFRRRVLHPQTVKHCLALLYSTGMYDYSGEWSFTVGVPAKSGVSGVLMVRHTVSISFFLACSCFDMWFLFSFSFSENVVLNILALPKKRKSPWRD